MFERFSAELALAWLLACVASHVCLQVALTTETFTALGALEGFLPCVSAHVSFEISVDTKTFVAFGAFVHFLFLVHYLMGFVQHSFCEMLPTKFTYE